MKNIKLIAASALLALPTVAFAEEFEVIGMYDGNSIDGTYTGVSIRATLIEGDQGSAETAQTGLRLRADSSVATFATNYDSTPGTGTANVQRVILTYGMPTSDTSSITIGVGGTQRSESVTPVTASSPADSTETGMFYSVELESTLDDGGRFQVIYEYDEVGANYASATYQLDMGNWRVGPTVNMVTDVDYSRTAYGLSAAFDLGDGLELGLTGAMASQTIGGGTPTDFSYIGMYLRSAF
jgi:hypothetical protein